MWQKRDSGTFRQQKKKIASFMLTLCIGSVVLAGCGAGNMTGASTSSNSSTSGIAAPVQHQASTDQKSGQSGSGNNATQAGPQYLTKSLQVTIEVQDTRQAASDLQQWVSTAAPQATSDGTNYQQIGDNQYQVTLTYLVDLAHYTQVGQHLRDYAAQDGRTLVSLQETVQDVTNDYVDTQAQLTNLHTEEQRLLTFLSQSQNMTDTLNIEQQLTQVEGQINTIQSHLDALKGQTTFYTVTINLQPIGSAPPPVTPTQWSVIPVWQGAWSAVAAVWQLLLTLLVWLSAFAVYIIPIVLIIWLLRKRPWQHAPRVAAVPLSNKPTEAEPK